MIVLLLDLGTPRVLGASSQKDRRKGITVKRTRKSDMKQAIK